MGGIRFLVTHSTPAKKWSKPLLRDVGKEDPICHQAEIFQARMRDDRRLRRSDRGMRCREKSAAGRVNGKIGFRRVIRPQAERRLCVMKFKGERSAKHVVWILRSKTFDCV
jgi:hypothetical protein